MDLLTVGEAFDDLVMAGLTRLPRLGEELRVGSLTHHPGGGAVITAIAAARLGARVGTLSAVSTGTAARLRREDVVVTNLRGAAERGAVTVALSTARDRAFVTFDGVNRVLEPRLLQAMAGLRRLPRHVHFALGPRRCDRWVSVVTRLRARGITSSWDFGWHEQLRHDPHFLRLLGAIDWVFVNEREATWYAATRTLASALRRWKEWTHGVVVKRGPRGAIALTNAGEVRAPAFRVAPIDTTGAGDAFDAGFLAALRAGAPVREALRLGNYVGAQSTRAAGGVDGLPARTQLPRWATRLLEAA